MRLVRPSPTRGSSGPAGWAMALAVVLASALYLMAWLSDINAKCHSGAYLGYACAIVHRGSSTAALRPPADQGDVVVAKPTRPAALQHSFTVWPSGTISEGETRTISTAYGELRCTSEGGASGSGATQQVSAKARMRTCWWN